MSLTEILSEIQKLPFIEQKELFAELSSNLNNESREQSGAPASEEQFLQMLYAEGVIGNIPDSSRYTDADDDFEPIEFTGKPISETIIEERR